LIGTAALDLGAVFLTTGFFDFALEAGALAGFLARAVLTVRTKSSGRLKRGRI
jgi:hypothetical protein